LSTPDVHTVRALSEVDVFAFYSVDRFDPMSTSDWQRSAEAMTSELAIFPMPSV
jgi:hypothetical protein